MYGKQGKNNDAISYLGRALSYNSEHAFARQTLAEVYLMQRDLGNAELELAKNIYNNPTYGKSYYFLGKLYMDELLNFQSAREYLTKFLLIDLDNATGYVADAKKRIEKLNRVLSGEEPPPPKVTPKNREL